MHLLQFLFIVLGLRLPRNNTATARFSKMKQNIKKYVSHPTFKQHIKQTNITVFFVGAFDCVGRKSAMSFYYLSFVLGLIVIDIVIVWN